MPLMSNQHSLFMHRIAPFFSSCFLPVSIGKVDVNLKESLRTLRAYSDRRTASCSRCYCSRPGLRAWICHCDSNVSKAVEGGRSNITVCLLGGNDPALAGAFWREDTASPILSTVGIWRSCV